ncbi:MAG: MATE family efflux transporter, partial [Aestuariivirgaceae bacterium]
MSCLRPTPCCSMCSSWPATCLTDSPLPPRPMSAHPQAKVGHREMLGIALPVMLSNLSVPLLGIVDTAAVGQLGDAYHIGAVAIGALIFDFVFWGFGFLRMGTSGFTAQAAGRGDDQELRDTL